MQNKELEHSPVRWAVTINYEISFLAKSIFMEFYCSYTNRKLTKLPKYLLRNIPKKEKELSIHFIFIFVLRKKS